MKQLPNVQQQTDRVEAEVVWIHVRECVGGDPFWDVGGTNLRLPFLLCYGRKNTPFRVSTVKDVC